MSQYLTPRRTPTMVSHRTPRSPLARYGAAAGRVLQIGAPYAKAIYQVAKHYNQKGAKRQRTKSARNSVISDKIPGEVNKTSIVLNLSRNRIPRLIAPGKMEILQTFQGTVSSGAGTQQVLSLFALGSIAQVQTSSGTTYSNLQGPISYFDVNPWQGRPAGNVFASAPNISNDVCFLRSFNIKMLFTNFASTPSIVQIYMLRVKRYTAQAPEPLFNTGFADDANGQPVFTLPASGIPAVRGYPNSSFPFISPNKDFEKYYEIVKRRDVLLSNTSSTEEISLFVRCNQVIKRDDLVAAAAATPGVFFRPGTFIIMVITKGSTVMKDATGGATGGVTLAPSKFGYIAWCKTNLRQMKGRNVMTDTVIASSQVNVNASAANLTQIENTAAGQEDTTYEEVP